MGRVCTVCVSPKRSEIDRDLAAPVVIFSEIARKYGFSHDTMHRHRHHVDEALIAAHQRNLERKAERAALSARDVVLDLVNDLREMAAECKRTGVGRDFLEVADRLVRANEQYAKINKELGTDQINVFLANIGVSSEEEARKRIELSRIGDPGPADMLEEGMTLIEMALARDGSLRETVGRRLLLTSYAEVVNGTGDEANGSGQDPQNGDRRGARHQAPPT